MVYDRQKFFIGGLGIAHQPVKQILVVAFEQLFKRLLFLTQRSRIAVEQIRLQPEIEFEHAATAGPTQSGCGSVIHLYTILQHAFTDGADSLGRAELFGADINAVHDAVTAIEFIRAFEFIQALFGGLVAAVFNKPAGL